MHISDHLACDGVGTPRSLPACDDDMIVSKLLMSVAVVGE
jgi:hypothetical protein